MPHQELIAQILGIAGMTMNILSFLQKSQKRIIVIQFFGAALFFLNYLLLGSTTGAMLNLSAVLRAIVYSNKEKFHAEIAVPEAGVSSREGRGMVNDDHKGKKDPEKLYTQVAAYFMFSCILSFCILFFCELFFRILFFCMLFFCVLYWHDLSLTFFSILCLSRRGHPSLPAGPTYTPRKEVC